MTLLQGFTLKYSTSLRKGKAQSPLTVSSDAPSELFLNWAADERKDHIKVSVVTERGLKLCLDLFNKQLANLTVVTHLSDVIDALREEERPRPLGDDGGGDERQVDVATAIEEGVE